ncbi:MAG TPA: hypothetical protein VNX88_24060 [Terriglobales bacterium]|jgi:hypothetical protein|nr:hypothetical protein [Terriglobales bacterium]
MTGQIARVVIALLFACRIMAAQQTSGGSPPSSESQLANAVEQLQKQIAKLESSVEELRTEASRYRAETLELQRRLEQISPPQQAQVQSEIAADVGSGEQSQPAARSSTARLSKLEEEYELLTGKVDEQYQTKVESGSRYRVRLSGLVMLNMFSNRGVPYSVDSPGVTPPTSISYGGGSFAGTLRQSQIGIEAFGPEWAGARVSGDLRFDFAGGFPNTGDGVTLGLMRLRTGNVRLNWSHTSLTAGQDSPLFSPLSPTSVISLVYPEFSYSGNLWTWTPQINVQHWFALPNSQRLTLAAGIVDPLTGELPSSQFERLPQAGEASRQPGYTARIGWSRATSEDRPLAIAASGYFSRQNWGFNRGVDGWALTSDWQIPVISRFGLKGEFYRGRALGGFGAAAGTSVLQSDSLLNRSAVVRGLDTIGGWTQASYEASPVVQFNAGYGLDNPFSDQVRQIAAVQNLFYPRLGRNRSAMANVIYRPRSDLLFSLEYRHIVSSRIGQATASIENIGMGIGLLF